jgi:hypothetical protein
VRNRLAEFDCRFFSATDSRARVGVDGQTRNRVQQTTDQSLVPCLWPCLSSVSSNQEMICSCRTHGPGMSRSYPLQQGNQPGLFRFRSRNKTDEPPNAVPQVKGSSRVLCSVGRRRRPLLAESIDTYERPGSILLSSIHSSAQSVECGRKFDRVCSIVDPHLGLV